MVTPTDVIIFANMSKTLHSSQSVSERRFAEKLTILNVRGHGLLTRIYTIKKVGELRTLFC